MDCHRQYLEKVPLRKKCNPRSSFKFSLDMVTQVRKRFLGAEQRGGVSKFFDPIRSHVIEKEKKSLKFKRQFLKTKKKWTADMLDSNLSTLIRLGNQFTVSEKKGFSDDGRPRHDNSSAVTVNRAKNYSGSS